MFVSCAILQGTKTKVPTSRRTDPTYPTNITADNGVGDNDERCGVYRTHWSQSMLLRHLSVKSRWQLSHNWASMTHLTDKRHMRLSIKQDWQIGHCSALLTYLPTMETAQRDKTLNLKQLSKGCHPTTQRQQKYMFAHFTITTSYCAKLGRKLLTSQGQFDLFNSPLIEENWSIRSKTTQTRG